MAVRDGAAIRGVVSAGSASTGDRVDKGEGVDKVDRATAIS
ncbi:hypothetical protein P7L64_02535 (plasmid) [Tistrella bauzanensis]|nr:hypothetical protein [Tistrella bauzanensis]